MPKILPWVAVVDDEEPIRRALLRLLRSAGIRARAFASGADFLASLTTSQPYCVVLDLNLPEMSGFDVLLSLKQSAAQIGVVVITGNHSAEIQTQAMLAKPLAYLRKPMDDQVLIDAIRLALLHVCQR